MHVGRWTEALSRHRSWVVVLAAVGVAGVVFGSVSAVTAASPSPAGQVISAADVTLSKDIPVVNEHEIDNTSCGVAAATMVLDYYAGPVDTAPTITQVAGYVAHDPNSGSATTAVSSGIENASRAAALGIDTPLSTAWRSTDRLHWASALSGQLQAGRPVVVFLADGGSLGWQWHGGHFIVVVGYTENGILYDDPWDGASHLIATNDFERAWGTVTRVNRAFQYMAIVSDQPLAVRSVPAGSGSPLSSAVSPVVPGAVPPPSAGSSQAARVAAGDHRRRRRLARLFKSGNRARSSPSRSIC